MIQFNEHKSEQKKEEKRFFIIIYGIVLLSGIYAGMYCLRFGILIDVKHHFESATYDFPQYFKFLTTSTDNNFDDVYLNFKFNEYIKLSNQRSRFVYSKDHFIHGEPWLLRENIYAKAVLKYNNEKFKVKAKLFGKNNDHFRHPYLWSFRVKAKDYIKDFKNGKFNLLQPNTRLFITDVLSNRVLARHDILSLEYKPINLRINDRQPDIYFVEDFFSKYLIERNGYRDSFIFTFSELKHPNSEDLSIGQRQDLENLKEDIRKNPDLILNTNKFDKFLALTFLAQNKHPYDVDNFHMFYNSVSNQVEPIIREVWFTTSLQLKSKMELLNQLKQFIGEVKRRNENLTSYLNGIITQEGHLEKIVNDIQIVAKNIEEIQATNDWKSFKQGIFARYPQAISLCRHIDPNVREVLALNLDRMVKEPEPVILSKTISANTQLQEDLVLYDTNLYLKPGITIDLNGNQIIIVSGAIHAIAEDLNKIKITNSSNKPSSIVIKNSLSSNVFKHVEFSGLSKFDKGYWQLPAGITFYESIVTMSDVSFDKNITGDDYVNFFRCDDFELINVKFKNVNADAIDSDFSKGKILNCDFFNIGNDAIDGSGSNISIRNCTFDSVEDKVISAGENSVMQIFDSTIQNSEIAFVSKDDSQLVEQKNTLINNRLDYCVFNKKKEFNYGWLKTDKDIRKANYLIEKGSRIYHGDEQILNIKVVDSVKESLYGIEYGKESRK